MRQFKLILIISIIALALGTLTMRNKPDITPDDNVIEIPETDKKPEVEINSKEVTLYFANEKYIETGNEELEKVMSKKRIIEYGDISLEEAVVRELLKGTEGENLSSPFPETARLLGVETSGGTAFVDFAAEGMNGGSLQEFFTIELIVRSLLELDSVDRVQFLLDGEKAESLMGHYEIMDPID